MKKFLPILFFFGIALMALAETQQGIVKTRGRMSAEGVLIPGTKLADVTITLNFGNALISDQQGEFAFNVPSGKKYSLLSAQKQGYTLADPEYIRLSFSYNASNPFYVVLEDENQRQADISKATENVRKTLKREIRLREDELDSLRESNAITQEKYDSLRIEFTKYRQNSETLVNEMAERFARIDYDQLDEYNRQLQMFIENGELLRADSLIKTRGSLEERYNRIIEQEDVNARREEELQKEQLALSRSKQLTEQEKEDLRNDLYAKHTIYLQQFQQDSALHCLKMRADLDTTNIIAVYEYAFYAFQQHDYIAAEKYFLSNLRNAQPIGNGLVIASIESMLGYVYQEIGDLTRSEDYLRKSIDYYECAIKSQYLNNDIYLILASSQSFLGRVYISAQRYEDAERYLIKSLNTIKKCNYNISYNLEAKNRGLIAELNSLLGSLYISMNKYDLALVHLNTSLKISEELFAQDPSDDNRSQLVGVYVILGEMYNYPLHNLDECEKYSKLILEHLEVLCSRNHQRYDIMMARIQTCLGWLYQETNRAYEGLALLKDAEEKLEQLSIEIPYATTYLIDNFIGQIYIYLESEQSDQAISHLEKAMYALENRSDLNGDNINTAKHFARIGQLLAILDRRHEAIKYLNNAIAIYETLNQTLAGVGLYELADSYVTIGGLYMASLDYSNSKDAYNKGLPFLINKYQHTKAPNDLSNLALSNLNLGVMYYFEGNQTKCLDHLKQAHSYYSTLYAHDNTQYAYLFAETLNLLAYNYATLREYNKALKTINKAISIQPNNAEYYDSKGEILLMQGKEDEAFAMWKKVLEIDPEFLQRYHEGTNLSNGLKDKGLIR